MKRSMKKQVEDYKKKFYGKKNGTEIYMGEMDELYNMSLEDGQLSVYRLISNAYDAGVMIGYRQGLREAKAKGATK